MKRQQLTQLIDLLSFLALIAMMVTGFVIAWSLPPRSGGAEIWALSRHQWGDIHFYSSLLFTALISLHLFFHLRYIKTALRGCASREHSYRLAAGVIGLIGLVTLLVILFTTPASPGASVEGRQLRHGQHATP